MFSPPELITEALSAPMYADTALQEEYLARGRPVLGDDERRLAHDISLWALGHLRLQDSRLPGFDRRQWSPSGAGLERLRRGLAPLTGRLRLLNLLETDLSTKDYAVDEDFGHHDQAIDQALAGFLASGTRTPEGGKLAHVIMPSGEHNDRLLVQTAERFARGAGLKTLLVASKRDRLRELIGVDGATGFGKYAPNLPVTTYFGEEKDLSGNVVGTTYATLRAMVEDDGIPNALWGAVLFDRAYHALGPDTRPAVERLISNKITLASTPVSGYALNRTIEQVFPTRLHELRPRAALEDGLCPPLRCWVYKTDFTVDLEPDELDYTPRELNRLAANEARNRMGAELFKILAGRGMRGGISCMGGDELLHPRLMKDLLTEEGFAIEIISQKTPPDDRHRISQQLSDRVTDGVLFVDVMDFTNKLDFLVNLRPTCSPIVNINRLMMVLGLGREAELGYVVDFIDDTEKPQQTALHAMEVYRYDPEYIYGKTARRPIDLPDQTHRPVVLPAELRHMVTRVSSMKVADIVFSPRYRPTHSERVSISDIARRLRQHPDVLVTLAQHLGLEAPLGEGEQSSSMLISEHDVARLEAALRRSQYRGLTEMPAAQREGLEDELLRVEASDVPPLRTDLRLPQMVSLLFGEQPPAPELAENLVLGLLDPAQRFMAKKILEMFAEEHDPPQIQRIGEMRHMFRAAIASYRGKRHEVIGSHTQENRAKQIVRAKLIGSMAGIDVQVPDEVDFSEVELLMRRRFPDGSDHPKHVLDNFASREDASIRYDTYEETTIGQYHLFESNVRVRVGGVSTSAFGRGLSGKEAQGAAADSWMKKHRQIMGEDGSADQVDQQDWDFVKAEPRQDERQESLTFVCRGTTYDFLQGNNVANAPHMWQAVTGERVEIVPGASRKTEGYFRFDIVRHPENGEPDVTAGPEVRGRGPAKREAALRFAEKMAGTVIP